jgi:hypothetical protein
VDNTRENPDPGAANGQNQAEVDTSAGRQRPNAKYPLTEKKTGTEELVFYYSRERRLSGAPPPVKALYEETPKKKFGLFRSLTATRPLTMLFISILFLCAAIVIISTVNAGTSCTLGGNRITVEAVQFRGETMVAMTKTVTDAENAYTGLVDIGVAPALSGESGAEDYPLFTHRIFFSLNTEEEYRFSLPFEANKLLVVLQGEQDAARLTISARRH